MNKPAKPAAKPRKKPPSPPQKNPTKRTPRKPAVGPLQPSLRVRLAWLAIESLAIMATITLGIIIMLGNGGHWFTGTHVLGNLFPFVVGVLVLILASSLFLLGWWQVRCYLKGRSLAWLPLAALGLACGLCLLIGADNLNQSFGRFRILVGGKQEAHRVTLTHQVFAAYRRHNTAYLEKMIRRAEAYRPAIEGAAAEYGIDPDLLQGIAAAESSFKPRDSTDGGHGLFQITAVPDRVLEDAKHRLGKETLSLNNSRDNAFIAAATLKHYLGEMKHDHYLALLAYNIGSANSGMRFIMAKYGVTDFVTIQPYLQLLPRDYPIRVFSYALAFRIWRKHGHLLAYHESENAALIQQIGLPELQ